MTASARYRRLGRAVKPHGSRLGQGSRLLSLQLAVCGTSATIHADDRTCQLLCVKGRQRSTRHGPLAGLQRFVPKDRIAFAAAGPRRRE